MTYLDSNSNRIVFASSPRTLSLWDTSGKKVKTRSTSESILQIASNITSNTFVSRHKSYIDIHNFENDTKINLNVLSKHLVPSPFEISVLKADSSTILLWDINANKSRTSSLKSSQQHFLLSHTYAIHPRMLCLTTKSSTILTLDLRSGRFDRIYESSNLHLGPIKSHPFNPFQIVTSGLNEILVLDSRYGRVPLLRWNHGMKDAPPEVLTIAPIRGGDGDTMICASSLSLRTAIKSKETCITVRSQTMTSASHRTMYGDRSIFVARYRSGLETKIPSPFVGHGRSAVQASTSLGIPVHISTSEDTCELWPREPIVGLIALPDDNATVMWAHRDGTVRARSMLSNSAIIGMTTTTTTTKEQDDSIRNIVISTTKNLSEVLKEERPKRLYIEMPSDYSIRKAVSSNLSSYNTKLTLASLLPLLRKDLKYGRLSCLDILRAINNISIFKLSPVRCCTLVSFSCDCSCMSDFKEKYNHEDTITATNILVFKCKCKRMSCLLDHAITISMIKKEEESDTAVVFAPPQAMSSSMGPLLTSAAKMWYA